MVQKYKNILEDPCSKKKCTACEIKNSLLESSKLTLRGLCKYSFFDTIYTIKYSPDSIISYLGVERTVISYDFMENVWTMRDVTNPEVLAVSQASFRSLAIGNINWTITNDTMCSEGRERFVLRHDDGECEVRSGQQGPLPHLLRQPSVHLQRRTLY